MVNLYRAGGAEEEELIDVRVEGDVLGLDWDEPEVDYQASARVAQECILYALPVGLFLEVCRRTPKAVVFLKSYFTIKDGSVRLERKALAFEMEENAASWPTHRDEVDQRAANRLVVARPEEAIRDVARRIAPGMQEAVVVVDAQECRLGVLTEADLSARVATEEVSVDAPVREIMTTPVVTIAPGTTAGEVIMIMIRRRRHHLVVTGTGRRAE